MRQLTGRVAVVTGAASGIGRAMAGRFAAEGLRCVLADIEAEPPQVIVCLARTSSTWQAISQARVFAVNVLAADQLPLARLFATKHHDKFRRMPVTSSQGIVGAPVLDGALSTLECRLAEAIMRDTHMVLIGKVVRLRHDRTKAPALYFRSRLYEGFEAARAGPPGLVGDGVRSSPGGGRS
jgi:flavin reductase (DIM6/NTAB) family NADH-FMN oxidoreductase RutF